MGIFDFLKKKTKYKTVFCGLDNSGKSTIISFIQEGKFVEHTPTMGKKKIEMQLGGTRFSLFDMGGQEDFRDLWMNEIKTAKLIVYVIDKSDINRFKEAQFELQKIFSAISNENVNILILGNKHDLKNSANLGQIIKEFNLFEYDNFEIMDISAKTGYGMADAFIKFYSLLTGENLKKNVFAKAVSVFDNSGDPIVTEVSNMVEIEKKVIEGGFLVALTQFSSNFDERKDISVITYESQSDGTFIVAKSKSFIGSLLWTQDLGSTIENSTDALKDLLEHLESTCQYNQNKDKENVTFHVRHFVTNLM